jgi:hypothetical protein
MYSVQFHSTENILQSSIILGKKSFKLKKVVLNQLKRFHKLLLHDKITLKRMENYAKNGNN